MSHKAVHCVPFKTNINVANAKQIKERDSVRVKHHSAGHQPHSHHGKQSDSPPQSQPCGSSGTSTCIPVMNNSVTYLASIGFGKPSTSCELLIDTGSSNTWVKREARKDTPTCTSIQYGQGATNGTICTDQVSLCPTLVIKDQMVGLADQASDMGDVSGTTADSTEIPTVTDNCVKQGLMKEAVIGISYRPTTADGNGMTGSLCFGGADPNMYTGDLNYVPLTKTSPASLYWGLDQSISYGDQEIMPIRAGIADTGTTLCMLPQSAFDAYRKATGAILDSATGLLCLTEDQYKRLKSMIFKIGDASRISSRCFQNEQLGGSADKLYCIFASMGQMENQGLDFINGYTFLQRFYSVYDGTNARLGFATTQDTKAESNY
ncbi:aspartic peptidase domain-containing protein [Mycena haematopus]|nr:aspartic peptidase domain-containing protein [Mycena haematopus]